MRFKRPAITCRFIGVSSTTRSRSPGAVNSECLLLTVVFSVIWGSGLKSPTGVQSETFCTSSKEKTDPSSYLLSTLSSLSMTERSCLVMASPRPVPSMLLVFLRSSLSKGSKRRFMSSSRIPIPVSLTRTEKRTESSSFSASFISKLTCPFSVYFTALVRILVIICFTLISSPIRSEGRLGSTAKLSSSPLASARNCTRL